MTDQEISDLLFIRESPVSADLAVVFGAANEDDLARRTRQGVYLLHNGHVPKLLMTGGGTLATKRPEAMRMADLARNSCVSQAHLLIESQSNNTFANARLSLELLREQGLLDALKTVILISSEWHMRRVLLTMRATFPPEVRFVCCPTLEGCSRETWMACDACRKQVLQELSILQAFQEAGLLPQG